MTFLVYETVRKQNQIRLRPTRQTADETYSLPRLVQRAWNKAKPANCGWEVSADELIRIHTDETQTYETRRLLSNFVPSSAKDIGIVEVLHIYAFTYVTDDRPEWAPFMLKGRDTFYGKCSSERQEREAGRSS
jgi:hypothetical protein